MMDREKLLDMGCDWLLYSNFFVYLDTEGQNAVLSAMTLRDYAANAVLIKNGSPPKGINIIVSGEVAVTVPSAESKLSSRGVRLGPGHLIGERSVLLESATIADVRALSPARCLYLSAPKLKNFLQQFESLRHYVENLMAIRERAGELSDILAMPMLLRDLNQSGIDYLLQASQIRKVHRDTRIIRAGEKDQDVYVVVSGAVSIRVPEETGKGLPLASGDRGFLFGEWSVLYAQPRSADVFMDEDGEILVIPGATFAAYMQQHPRMRRAVEKQRAPQWTSKTVHTQVITFAGTTLEQETAVLAYGTAGVLGRQGIEQNGEQGCETVLIDFGWDHTASRLGFATKKKNIGGLWVKAAKTPTPWPFQVLIPKNTGQLAVLLSRLRGKVQQIVIASPWQKPCREALKGADTVVTVSDDRKSAHAIEKRWGQLHIQAFRLGNRAAGDTLSGVVPHEVRFFDDHGLAEGFWRNKTWDVLTNADNSIGETCCRIVRIIKGRSVGIALGGGAAWGSAHVGLIRTMIAHGMPIDYVAGSSAGAMVAGFYAGGGIAAIEEMLRRKWLITPVAASCLVNSYPLQWMIKQVIGNLRVHETRIPFYPIVTDIHNGNEVIITRGSVASAVRMSCGLPGLFPAVCKGEFRYIDGGVSNNVPASVVRQAGADFVVASNVIPSSPSRRKPISKNQVVNWLSGQTIGRANDLMRSLFLLFWRAGCDRSRHADYLIDLAPSNYLPTDFHKSDKMADQACALAESHMPFILDAYNADKNHNHALP